MAKMTAAERYAARKQRVAVSLRARTIEAANRGARHARLEAKYGRDWRAVLATRRAVREQEWNEVVERTTTSLNPGWDGLVDYLQRGVV